MSDRITSEYRKDRREVRLTFRTHQSLEKLKLGLNQAVEGALCLMEAHGRKCDCGLCEIARGAIYNLRLYRREIHYQEPPSPFEVQAAWDETIGNIRGEEAREQEERDRQRDAGKAKGDAAAGGRRPRKRRRRRRRGIAAPDNDKAHGLTPVGFLRSCHFSRHSSPASGG